MGIEYYIAGALIVAGAAFIFFTRRADLNQDGVVDKEDAKEAVEIAKEAVEEVVEQVDRAVDERVKQAATKTTTKLVSDAKLEAMSKVQLDDYAKTLGVNLDRRRTKERMIADLKAAVK